MASSIDDEILEIESFRPPDKSFSNQVGPQGKREKSSMDSADTFNSEDYMKDDLLVSFPSRTSGEASSSGNIGMNGSAVGAASSSPSAPPSMAKQRNSISVNPMAMRAALAGIADLVDSDDDDEGGKSRTKSKEPAPPQHAPNPKASGGPDHRPLVGGFAAAAYEAARVDYYKKQGILPRGHNVRPRSHYHYP